MFKMRWRVQLVSVYVRVVEIIGFISLYLWLSSILWKNVLCFCFMDWEKFVWSRVLLFLAFWSKTFRYEFYTRSEKKPHPIRKSYLINTAFWLVDFWVGVQNWYFKALWPWGLEYWNFHTFIVKLQKKKKSKLYKHSLIFFFLQIST